MQVPPPCILVLHTHKVREEASTNNSFCASLPFGERFKKVQELGRTCPILSSGTEGQGPPLTRAAGQRGTVCSTAGGEGDFAVKRLG